MDWFWICAVALVAAATEVRAAAISDDNFITRINVSVSGNVSDNADAIAKFLGFRCPKGHRCLPVLECLPCDYGTYKAEEGSDLCTPCPGGCTTLRKGAESKQECLPKCPPGYEESECGKTCTKCRAGYYKSTWKNKPCSACPVQSTWDRNLVGMTKMNQCYEVEPSDDPDTTQSPNPTQGQDMCRHKYGSCTKDEYDIVRLRVLEGSGCEKFCQCAHATTSSTGSVSYYWEEHTCPAGTLFDESLPTPTCNHQNVVTCTSSSSTSTTTTTTTPPIGDQCRLKYGRCTKDEYDNVRLRVLEGSGCEKFCQCAHETTSSTGSVSYYWEEHTCAYGTLFDESLPTPTCNHQNVVTCPPSTLRSTTSSSPGTTSGDRCEANYGTCTVDEYNAVRYKTLPGSGCTKFCQCAHAAGSSGNDVYYYWQEQSCGTGTLFDSTLQVCNHAYLVQCNDSTTTTSRTTTTPSTTTTSGPAECIPGDPCTANDESSHRTLPWWGTECQGYCACVGLVWTSKWCHDTLRYDPTLYIPACNYMDYVNCTDGDWNLPRPPTTPPCTDLTVPEWGQCTPGDDCSSCEYSRSRVIPYYGTNCTQYCQCEQTTQSNGNQAFVWKIQRCPTKTILDQNLPTPNCNWKSATTCADCPDAQADIVFVLDSSGSVGSSNFKKMLQFVNQIIQVFNVSSQTTRFAVVTYGDYVYQYFQFSTYQNKNTLQKEVEKISYPGGYTYTHSALSFVQSSILGASDNRPDAKDIVIVLTDGKSTYPTFTAYYASKLHQVADMVLAVGISGADVDELEDIASSNQYVYFIDNFDALNVLKKELRQETCGSSSSSDYTTTTFSTSSGSNGSTRSTITNAPTGTDTTTTPPTIVVSVTSDGCPTSSCSGIRLVAMGATNCTKYCQCNTATSAWVLNRQCPASLRFNNLLQVCDWDYNVDPVSCWPSTQHDPTTTTTPVTTTTPPDISLDECIPGEQCTSYEESTSRTIPRRGTGCQGYCVCKGLQWEAKWCDPTLRYDQSLYVPACNYKDYINCTDSNSITRPTTPSVTPNYTVPVWGSCKPGDACNDYEYSISRVINYYGTNCSQYCQCEKTTKNNGEKVLTWEIQRCPTQTILDQNLPTPNCNWQFATTCVECPYAKADIVFVLDSSGSIGSSNFVKILQFVNQIIQVFDVSRQTTRFALVTYGDNVYEYFQFSKYHDKDDLQKAIETTAYPGGYTYTHSALSFVQSSILGASDNRPDAKDIVMVVTDGKSTYSSLTTYYAARLHQVADMVLAIGISGADVDELEDIASSNQYVYFIDNFDALNVLKKELRQETCVSSSGGTTSLAPSPTTTGFGSGTGPTSKPTAIPTTGDPASSTDMTTIPVSADGCPTSQCDGVRLIAMGATNCTKFCQCDTAQQKWIAYLSCPALLRFNNLAQVCDWYYNVDPKTCWPADLGQPADPTTQPTTTTTPVPTTTTPGHSLDQCTPGAACTSFEESSARTIPWPGTGCQGYCKCTRSVWVGHWCDPDLAYDQTLFVPACNWEDYVTCNEDPSVPTVTPPPTQPTVTPDISVPWYGTCTPGDRCTSYERTTNRVLTYYGTNCTQYCQCVETTASGGTQVLKWGIKQCPSQTLLDQTLPSPNCNWKFAATCVECPTAVADIVFVLDSSGSVGSTNFAKMLEFVNQIIQVFDVSPTSTRFAVVTFGDDVYQDFPLGRYNNKTELQTAVKNLYYYMGYTYTHTALQFVQNTILAASDNRPLARDIVIVITDGKSTLQYSTKVAAQSLHQHADMVFAVGIGNADQTELENIASSPQNVYFIDTFDALNRLKNELRQETCGGSVSATGIPTSSTTGSTAARTQSTSAPPTAAATADGCPITSCSGNVHIAVPASGCAKYCQCDTNSNKWIPMGSCPTGLIFNNLAQICDWESNVNKATCRPNVP